MTEGQDTEISREVLVELAEQIHKDGMEQRRANDKRPYRRGVGSGMAKAAARILREFDTGGNDE